MKRFLLLLALISILSIAAGSAEPVVPPTPVNGNVVVDQLGWLKPDQVEQINRLNAALDQEGFAQIAVMTTDDCGSDKVQFRNKVFNTWGIGHRNKNDGLLIMVCWYGGDKNRRSVEQETGYGMEQYLPDVLTDRVAREVFRPYFAANRPGDGLFQMVVAYDKIIRNKGGEYEAAIKDALVPLSVGGAVPNVEGGATPQGHPEGNSDWLFTQSFLGLQCFWWIVMLVVLFIIFYVWAASSGLITSSGSSYSSSSSSSDSSSSDSSSFSGGSSGSGGSSTNF